MIATRKAVRELQLEYGIATDRVYTGSFMTSLDMQGFSISIMKSDATILQCLDSSTQAPCWPAGTNGNKFVLDSNLIYHGSNFLHSG